LNLRNTGRLVVAGLAIASALTITACSDDSSDSTTTHASATSTSAAPAAPAVTADVINAELQKVLNPATPFAEKVTYLQGMDADPHLADELAKVYAQNSVNVTVLSVTPLGGNQAQATASMTVNGKPVDPSSTPVIPLVYENGKWKVAKDFTCGILTNLGKISSPACPAQATS